MSNLVTMEIGDHFVSIPYRLGM